MGLFAEMCAEMARTDHRVLMMDWATRDRMVADPDYLLATSGPTPPLADVVVSVSPAVSGWRTAASCLLGEKV